MGTQGPFGGLHALSPGLASLQCYVTCRGEHLVDLAGSPCADTKGAAE